MRIRVAGIIVSLCATSFMMLGCGQKGPLFMPKDIVTNQSDEPQLAPGPNEANNANNANFQTQTPQSEAPANKNTRVQPSSDNER